MYLFWKDLQASILQCCILWRVDSFGSCMQVLNYPVCSLIDFSDLSFSFLSCHSGHLARFKILSCNLCWKFLPGANITGSAWISEFVPQAVISHLSMKVTSHLSIKESMQLISSSMYDHFFLQVILRSACLSEDVFHVPWTCHLVFGEEFQVRMWPREQTRTSISKQCSLLIIIDCNLPAVCSFPWWLSVAGFRTSTSWFIMDWCGAWVLGIISLLQHQSCNVFILERFAGKYSAVLHFVKGWFIWILHLAPVVCHSISSPVVACHQWPSAACPRRP